jgi:hypothetical protein
MRIGLFTNFYLVFILLVLSSLILFSAQALDTLDDITQAERQKYKSLQLANELFQSSEDLTKMGRSYVITGDSAYERFFFEILDIRNGKRPRPPDYSIPYWDPEKPPAPSAPGNAISLLDLMRREGFSKRELDLLQRSQRNSDSLVNLEKQAFAAIRGLCGDRYGNFTLPCAPDRDFAINLLFGKHYQAEKGRIMAPIRQFMLELGARSIISAARRAASRKAAIPPAATSPPIMKSLNSAPASTPWRKRLNMKSSNSNRSRNRYARD